LFGQAIHLKNTSIAVEISTLVQHVPSALGHSRSRYSDDESALRIIQEIKDAIPAFLLNGRTVILTLSPPIKKFRQTRNQPELTVHNEDDCRATRVLLDGIRGLS